MNEQRSPYIPNPVWGGLLGICPLAAAANSLVNGCVLGAGVALSAIIIALAMPFLQSFVPDRLRTPASLALSAAISLLIGAGVEAFSPSTAIGLNIYIPLLTVNCLSLQALRHNPFALDREGRVFGSQYGLGRTTLLKESLGYIAAAALIGALREVLGAGTLSFFSPGAQWFFFSLSDDSPARIFSAPAGGFIVLGFLAALYRVATNGRRRKGA
jgi:electron transport complex protein RnfE